MLRPGENEDYKKGMLLNTQMGDPSPNRSSDS